MIPPIECVHELHKVEGYGNLDRTELAELYGSGWVDIFQITF